MGEQGAGENIDREALSGQPFALAITESTILIYVCLLRLEKLLLFCVLGMERSSDVTLRALRM